MKSNKKIDTTAERRENYKERESEPGWIVNKRQLTRVVKGKMKEEKSIERLLHTWKKSTIPIVMAVKVERWWIDGDDGVHSLRLCLWTPGFDRKCTNYLRVYARVANTDTAQDS